MNPSNFYGGNARNDFRSIINPNAGGNGNVNTNAGNLGADANNAITAPSFIPPQPGQLQPQPHQRKEFAVEAIDLIKDYGKGENAVHALRNVNVGFEQGKFTAIMGPSGSGKSTMMHTLAGLDSVTSGRVVLGGQDITKMNDNQLTMLRRTKIGFIFQSFNLLPMFTAEQNIVMPLTLAGAKVDKQWFATLVETLGLTQRLKHRPNELSGGQQQRVAIARALISKPQVVFADEPTGNLDSVSSAEVLSFLKRSVREFGQTVVMVTHDAVAASYADRAIVFADGRIVADEPHPTAEHMSQLLMEESERAARQGAMPTMSQLMDGKPRHARASR
ncbi:ABC transporter ATP-binding protein [Bifidobacterium sp. ESL0764]|uniref:ABC transporter ATP-binding protein n=1 Tax=Bifidobacterium sp. ESL0764 TaxID=2983228 RepID=UPI0023F67C42|nr:ABC transporter ATP-binding protein [Bifidobacterium sp. ESL0764]WEV65266.1 ABC transporter ATP-binding protein [Bifidobacterium sp. ESL0764]